MPTPLSIFPGGFSWREAKEIRGEVALARHFTAPRSLCYRTAAVGQAETPTTSADLGNPQDAAFVLRALQGPVAPAGSRRPLRLNGPSWIWATDVPPLCPPLRVASGSYTRMVVTGLVYDYCVKAGRQSSMGWVMGTWRLMGT